MSSPSTSVHDELLTPPEAAAYLKVAVQTIYDWVYDGKIPVERAGRSLRFRRSDLDTWLKRGQEPPSGDAA
jgi:excisionase family DNA binding protein